MAIALLTAGVIVLACLVGSFGAVALKMGAKGFSLNILKIIKNGKIMFGIICYGVSTLLYVFALKGEELSVVYPLVSLTYVFISLLSIKLLHERMSIPRWLGVCAIIGGIILIGIGS